MLRRLVALALAVLVALGAMGCRGRRLGPTVPTRADARWQRRLEGLARRELGCRAVRIIALNESVWQADGCGNLMEYELLCAGRHCSWHRIEPAALRASRDFACPLGSLSAAVPSATRRDLAGCGRAASYTLTCGATHCEWQTYGATPPPAAPGVYGTVAVPAPSVGDESLADVLIPPPPGAAAPAASPAPPTVTVEPPQPITAVPPPPTAGTTAPASPPPGTAAAPPGPPAGSDDIVIPPPPP